MTTKKLAAVRSHRGPLAPGHCRRRPSLAFPIWHSDRAASARRCACSDRRAGAWSNRRTCTRDHRRPCGRRRRACPHRGAGQAMEPRGERRDGEALCRLARPSRLLRHPADFRRELRASRPTEARSIRPRPGVRRAWPRARLPARRRVDRRRQDRRRQRRAHLRQRRQVDRSSRRNRDRRELSAVARCEVAFGRG